MLAEGREKRSTGLGLGPMRNHRTFSSEVVMNKLLLPLILLPLMLCACASTPTNSDAERHALVSESDAALKSMLLSDPSLQEWIDNGYAYAVFPAVGKGGVI